MLLLIDDAVAAQDKIIAYGFTTTFQRILQAQLGLFSGATVVPISEIKDITDIREDGNVIGVVVDATYQKDIKSVIESSGSIPVLAVATWDKKELILLQKNSGACSFLSKPFTPELFHEKLTLCGIL